MEYEIKEFDGTKVSDDELEQMFDLGDVLFREYEKDDPFTPREFRKKGWRDPHPDYGTANWAVYNENGQIIANAGIGWSKESAPNYDTNQHVCSGGIGVHPDYRGKGIAKALAKLICEVAEKENRTTIQTGANLEVGLQFLEHLGGTKAIEGSQNRLQMEDVDWNMIREWADAGPKRAEGVTLFEFQDCPEDLIEDYVKVYTETMNQAPMGEMEGEMKVTPESRRLSEKRQAERDTLWFTLITKEADGNISGLTEIFYNSQMPWQLMQNLTGVDERYRGRGLGKWLKAEMLLRMREKYPDAKYVVTGNADTNAPMLSINNRMGFKKHFGGTGYKFKTEKLKTTLYS